MWREFQEKKNCVYLLRMAIFYYYQHSYKSYDVCILHQPCTNIYFSVRAWSSSRLLFLYDAFFKWLLEFVSLEVWARSAVNIITFYYVLEIYFFLKKKLWLIFFVLWVFWQGSGKSWEFVMKIGFGFWGRRYRKTAEISIKLLEIMTKLFMSVLVDFKT